MNGGASTSHADTESETTNLTKKTFLDSLTSFIIEDLHTVSIVNDNGFKKLMKTLKVDSLLPNIDSLLTNIDYLHDIEIIKVKDQLKDINAISLSIERWETVSKDVYNTIRTNYIDNDWLPQSILLATKIATECKPPELDSQIKETVSCFEIENKIVSLVCDGEPHATTSLSKHSRFGARIDCFAFKLQNSIDDSLKGIPEIHNTLKKCKALVSHFQHSEQAEGYLRNYQKFLEVTIDSLVQYNTREINSVYTMLDRLSKQKAPINSVLSDQDITDAETAARLNLTEAEWNIIEGVVNTLKPFQLAKLVVFPEQGQEATASMIKPLIDSFCKNFFTCDNKKDTAIVKKLKTTIKQNLIKNFKMYDSNSTEIRDSDYLDIATYLDPRYKNQDYLGSRQKELIRIDIREKLFGNTNTDNVPESKNPVKRTEPDSEGPSRRSRSAKALDLLFPSVSKKKETVHSEWTSYVNESEIDKNLDIHVWWKRHESHYPVLSKAAKTYLCTLAMAKPKQASNNVEFRRACLTPQCIEKLIFLNNKLY